MTTKNRKLPLIFFINYANFLNKLAFMMMMKVVKPPKNGTFVPPKDAKLPRDNAKALSEDPKLPRDNAFALSEDAKFPQKSNLPSKIQDT
ncbi:MAG: hypothetical protein QW303_04980 [Nitrososphaerota archaeon]